MNILLDTHTALWSIVVDPRLTEKARDIILNPMNTIYYSVVSTWEIMLKHNRRPDEFDMDSKQFTEYCQKTGFYPVDLKEKHIHMVTSLMRPDGAPEHNDPFDRVLLAQAKSENYYFLTRDRKIAYYNEPCVIMY